MNTGNENALAMLGEAFMRLGATADQARVMAKQLLKRAVQISAERGIPEVAAMQELLEKVARGRQGEYTGDVPPGSD